MHHLSRQFIKFFLVGFSAFVIDFTILNSLVYLLNFKLRILGFILVPNLISSSIAVIYAFYFQRKWTFGADSDRVKQEFAGFVLLQLFNLLFFNGLVFSAVVHYGGIPIPIAKILVAAVQMTSSFLIMRHLVFRSAEPAA